MKWERVKMKYKKNCVDEKRERNWRLREIISSNCDDTAWVRGEGSLENCDNISISTFYDTFFFNFFHLCFSVSYTSNFSLCEFNFTLSLSVAEPKFPSEIVRIFIRPQRSSSRENIWIIQQGIIGDDKFANFFISWTSKKKWSNAMSSRSVEVAHAICYGNTTRLRKSRRERLSKRQNLNNSKAPFFCHSRRRRSTHSNFLASWSGVLP